ncbi:tetratricopeptide repeat protein [Weissella kandleri]|uniref:tetratricopeptide repeat protein n=1 Tax=Weissella kandleri TaxID=1616 RepID=UPI00387E8A73
MADDKEQATQAKIHQLITLIDQNPNDYAPYVDLINLLTTLENLPEAEELALKSLSLFVDQPAALEQLNYATGNVYYMAGKYEQAQAFFQKINDAKLQHDALMMQAQAAYNQKKYQQALAFTLTGVEQQPDDLAAQILLGNLWLSLGDLDAGGKAFAVALELDADNFDANFGRGLVALTQGELNNAWLKQAQALDADKYQQQSAVLDELMRAQLGKDDAE